MTLGKDIISLVIWLMRYFIKGVIKILKNKMRSKTGFMIFDDERSRHLHLFLVDGNALFLYFRNRYNIFEPF